MRAKQAGQLAGRRDGTDHHCLVCSLVARQARTLLARPHSPAKNRSSSTRSGRGTLAAFTQKMSNKTSSNQMAPPPPRRRFISPSNKVADASAVSSIPLGSTTTLVSSFSVGMQKQQEGQLKSSKNRVTFCDSCDEREQEHTVARRPRSASDVGASRREEQDTAVRRARSASVGAPLACETIEEEVPSDSSTGSVDHIDFSNINISS